MTCPNNNLFQDWTTPIEVISGVPFEDVLPYFQRAMNTDRAHPGDGQEGP
jgi:hypothetical protein